MKAIRINGYLMPVLAVLALLGSVWIAKAAGAWQTSGRDQVMLDESGQPDPVGIKGWMTLAGVSEDYGVPLDALYTMIGAAPDLPADTPLKELEGFVPGFSVSTVRAGVAAYLDGSWSPADGPYVVTEGEGEVATPQPEETGGRLPASEIKGGMTLQEVIEECQVPLDYLRTELGLPVDVDTGLALRNVAESLGIEVTVVRDAVQLYQDSH